jgi:hypothetical protein
MFDEPSPALGRILRVGSGSGRSIPSTVFTVGEPAGAVADPDGVVVPAVPVLAGV